MAMPMWVVGLIKRTFPGIFSIARLTRAPGVGRIIDKALFEGDSMIYLPRDRVIRIEGDVAPPPETVLPSRLVEHFINQANYLWMMDACICRESNHCQDYPHDLGCLFLGQAAMKINPGLGRPVSREQALDHVRRCREAGLVHLIGRNKLDTVWLGVGPGDRLLTICNCCPCCCLWRVIPLLKQDISAKVTKMPGVEVKVTEECQGCGECAEGVCFVDAVRLEGGRAIIGDQCRGCGRCVDACPHHAIELCVDMERALGEAIDRIGPLVDLS